MQTSETFQIFKDRVAVLIHPVWPALLLASGGRDHCVGDIRGKHDSIRQRFGYRRCGLARTAREVQDFACSSVEGFDHLIAHSGPWAIGVSMILRDYVYRGGRR